MMTFEESKIIAEKLHRVGAENPCPRCGHTHFDVIADGYVMLNVDVEGDTPSIFTPLAMPCVSLCCAKCGWLSLHSKVRLDILAKKAENSEPAPVTPAPTP